VLTIANKQDLAGTMKSIEIEQIMGYPNIGISAIAPDASKQSEKIILDFLNLD